MIGRGYLSTKHGPKSKLTNEKSTPGFFADPFKMNVYVGPETIESETVLLAPFKRHGASG